MGTYEICISHSLHFCFFFLVTIYVMKTLDEGPGSALWQGRQGSRNARGTAGKRGEKNDGARQDFLPLFC